MAHRSTLKPRPDFDERGVVRRHSECEPPMIGCSAHFLVVARKLPPLWHAHHPAQRGWNIHPH